MIYYTTQHAHITPPPPPSLFSDTEGSIDKGVVISTTSNMAYEMTTLPGEGGVDDHEYEVIGRGRGNTHTATQGDEGLYEIPSSVTQYPYSYTGR